MARFPSESKLAFWATHGLNVLFEGPHGVGKTALAEKTFNEIFGERGRDWLYFSAATMDPWVDFVGVPKERVADDGVVFLDLVRPEVFERDQVKAIIFDEFNRAPKKVRNAVMELMQFGSINGHRFTNLKCVWAAVNPSNDDENDYDVEEIDPAQLDRFHVHFQFGYDVSVQYFYEKYGEKGTIACEWWKSLTTDLQKSISPRRLDYCMKVESLGGSIKDILPAGAPCKDLISQLKSGSFIRILEEMKEGSIGRKEMRERLTDPSFYTFVENKVKNDDELASKLVPHMSAENVAKFCQSNSIHKFEKILEKVDASDSPEFFDALKEMAQSTTVSQTKRRKINAWLTTNSNVYQYEGLSEDLLQFLSIDPQNPYEETTHHRNARIQNFLSHIGEHGLTEIQKDLSTRKAVVNVWLTILDRGQLVSLSNDIMERILFVINGTKKDKVKKAMLEFFGWEEFNLSTDDKRLAKIRTIVDAIQQEKK